MTLDDETLGALWQFAVAVMIATAPQRWALGLGDLDVTPLRRFAERIEDTSLSAAIR